MEEAEYLGSRGWREEKRRGRGEEEGEEEKKIRKSDKPESAKIHFKDTYNPPITYTTTDNI